MRTILEFFAQIIDALLDGSWVTPIPFTHDYEEAIFDDPDVRNAIQMAKWKARSRGVFDPAKVSVVIHRESIQRNQPIILHPRAGLPTQRS